ncbi:LacI family DNA-binding transcriptional regulator [Nakamurella deserti]|uniref:LacI family DNA-binding transcriptional regulator n=1 Tax=Nakamurella deserti TaxID=2164074 RepID=UPI000DBE9128|nr:LacI family DNA-binding transcriptional regulator [Nakamurella deserti]
MNRATQHTIVDVAAAAGVSRASAARALGGYGYTSKEIQARVQAAAEQLGYRPSRIARTMRNGRSDTIGFVCADISDAFFSTAMRGICDVASDQGYQVFVSNSDNRLDLEKTATAAMLSHRVDGLILSPISVRQHEHLDAMGHDGLPMVMLDRQLKGLGVDSVVADNESATRTAVGRLVALGHRRIGFLVSVQPEEPPTLKVSSTGTRISGPSRPSADRARGYLKALADAGIPPDQDLVAFIPHNEPELRRQAVRRILQLAVPPTALFTADSYMTRSAFVGLAETRLRIPEDISLLGFDDLEWTTFVTPPVSVVVQPAYEMGRVAAERLFGRIHGDDGADRRITVATRFVERESMGAPPTSGAVPAPV